MAPILKPIYFTLDTPDAKLPTQAHPGDAGFDLYADRDCELTPGSYAEVHTGICMELPEGYWAAIVGRSSSLVKRRLSVTYSVIDQGYRGLLYAYTQNVGDQTQYILKGDRVAQLVPARVEADHLQPTVTESLAHHVRGANGIGSTGI